MEITNNNGMEFISVSNNKNLKIVFNNLGASIYCIYFYKDIMTTQVVNDKDFLNENVYFGKTVGRVAGRIANHKLVINGETYNLSNNEGETTLHGGHQGIGTRLFSSNVKQEKDKIIVEYCYISKDGESGFPGDATIKVYYTVYLEEDKMDILYNVTTTKTCPISLSPHTLFCLGDSSIDNLSLFIDADKYIHTSFDTLVVEEAKDVPPCLDFRKSHKIIDMINDPLLNKGMLKGYDHNFLVNKNSAKPQVVLENDKYSLQINSDYDCVVMYSDNYSDKYEFNSSKLDHHRCIAIEPECSLLEDILLYPNQVFEHKISYSFFKK